jgi:predicted transcriptional regulator
MLRDGKKQREIAKIFGVSEAAVSQAKKKLKHSIIRVVALEKANDVYESHIDVRVELKRINRAITEELDRAKEAVVEAKGKDRLAIQEVIIKLAAEVRRQLEAQMKLFEAWRDTKINAEFQDEVFRILDGMQPGVRDEAIRRIRQAGALRGAITIS